MHSESERGVEVTTAIYDELRRQCSIGAGEYEADAETGLFTISADLDLGAVATAVLATNPTTGWRCDMDAAAALIDEWTKPQTMRLHAGELTTAEVRTVQAVLRGLAAAVRRLPPPTTPPAGGEHVG